MGLTECPDCGRRISDQAPACVECGRPMSASGELRLVCEVVLRQVHGFGFLNLLDALWALEAQVMTPEGVKVVARREYTSNNDLALFQGEKKGFIKARREITDELLRRGW